jgi:hypothetical protein
MRTWLPILGLALAACGRESTPPPATKAAPPLSVPPAAHTATMARLDSLAATSDRVSAESMKSVGGRLQYEATHRPAAAGSPRVEDVLASFDAAGIALAEQKQYIAMTVKAAYCVGGQTKDGLSIAVCEYATPAAAEAGRTFVTERFRIPDLDRAIHVRGATTLALGHHVSLPLGDVARRAEQAFRSL